MTAEICVLNKRSATPVFTLSNPKISYIFRVSPEGILEHLHFGARIEPRSHYPSEPRRLHRGCILEFQESKFYDLSDVPQEFPVFGTGDNRLPALHVINSDGNSTQMFQYERYEIVDNKPALTDLPSARGGNSQTLLVTLIDQVSNNSVEFDQRRP